MYHSIVERLAAFMFRKRYCCMDMCMYCVAISVLLVITKVTHIIHLQRTVMVISWAMDKLSLGHLLGRIHVLSYRYHCRVNESPSGIISSGIDESSGSHDVSFSSLIFRCHRNFSQKHIQVNQLKI